MSSQPWHSMSIEQVLEKLNSSKEGLSAVEARSKLQKYGPNELQKKGGVSPLTIFINQFKSILVLLLVLAVGISVAIGHFVDGVVIAIIVLVNAILGFIQEYRAERSMEALKKLSAPKAHVMRDGKEVEIEATQVVPGDILVLSEGDKVPADARLIEVFNLQTSEAGLTGESTPVTKKIDTINKEKLTVGERKNCVFMNTVITRGRGLAVVVDTGMESEVGHIAKLLQVVEKKPTPLQVKLGEVAKSLGLAVVVIATVVFGIGVFRGEPIFDMFLTAVSLAVAAVPEGLPAVVTITLALGLSRMARARAYIRKLPAVETLGSASVICSDKTGTLTKNEMTVEQIYTNHKIYSVSGEGYEPKGNFSFGNKVVDPVKDRNIERLLLSGTLCTTSNLYHNKKGWYVTGDPTEGALVVAAEKAGLDKQELSKKFKHIAELPFDSSRKMMSVIFEDPSKKKVAFIKGAPEILLSKSEYIMVGGSVRKMSKEDRKKISDMNEKMASQALRVLAVGYKYVSTKEKYTIGNVEDNIVFVGLQGMIDPPHEEVKAAIANCKSAGIIPVMITGDYAVTAKAIAMQLNLVRDGAQVVTGAELDKMSAKKLEEVVQRVRIFARVSPEHKVRIVQAFKKHKYIVAMTGDGVNDAPAIKQADIGIAMGKKGTDVAKEASEMILGDDNFATIVKAVEEGRGIYDNIRKFIRYLLSSNIGEVLTIFAAALFGLPLPLIAVQLLWMNLLTDGLPALALGVDPPEKDIMKRPPRDPKERTISKDTWAFSAIVGVVMMIGTLLLFKYYLSDLTLARTIAFSTIVVYQLLNVFNARSDESIFKDKTTFKNRYLLLAVLASFALQLVVVYLPFLQQYFGTVALGIVHWVWIIGMGLTVIAVIEIKKLLVPEAAKS